MLLQVGRWSIINAFKCVIITPTILVLTIILMMFFTSPEVDDNDLNIMYNMNTNDVNISADEMQERIQTLEADNTQLSVAIGVQGTASTSKESVNAIASDEDSQKVANWFNSVATGPCQGLGQYIVAKAKEQGVPIFLAIAIPCCESTAGANCVKPNNFAGIKDTSGNFMAFSKPEDCADTMIRYICGYRDGKIGRTVDITNVTSVGSVYCIPPDHWVDLVWKKISECQAATGVAPDVTK